MGKTIIVQGHELNQAEIEGSTDPVGSRRKGTLANFASTMQPTELAHADRSAQGHVLADHVEAALAGLIVLPPKGRQPGKSTSAPIEFPIEPIFQYIGELTPLWIELVKARSDDACLLLHMFSSYHYLVFQTNVGETIGYLVRDQHDRLVVCAVFGTAAWKTAPRARSIGWDAELRAKTAKQNRQQYRYLILSWVEALHLASQLPVLLALRIRFDWIEKYGHPLALLETFVDLTRIIHKSTCRS